MCIVFHHAQYSTLNILKRRNNVFSSSELKQTSGENFVSKFRVVSKFWHKIPQFGIRSRKSLNLIKCQKLLECLNTFSLRNLLHRRLEHKYNSNEGNISFYCNKVCFFFSIFHSPIIVVQFGKLKEADTLSSWTFANQHFCLLDFLKIWTFPKHVNYENLKNWRKETSTKHQHLTELHPIFHLWRNQVVGCYQQNLWKIPVEKWNVK